MEGVSKSPILSFYQSQGKQIEKRNIFIVFLSWNEEDKTYAIAATDAFEEKAYKPVIKSLIEKSLKPKSRPGASED